MPRVIGHPAHPLDHFGHPRQRPHVGRVAVGLSAVSQRGLDLRPGAYNDETLIEFLTDVHHIEQRRARLVWLRGLRGYSGASA